MSKNIMNILIQNVERMPERKDEFVLRFIEFIQKNKSNDPIVDLLLKKFKEEPNRKVEIVYDFISFIQHMESKLN